MKKLFSGLKNLLKKKQKGRPKLDSLEELKADSSTDFSEDTADVEIPEEFYDENELDDSSEEFEAEESEETVQELTRDNIDDFDADEQIEDTFAESTAEIDLNEMQAQEEGAEFDQEEEESEFEDEEIDSEEPPELNPLESDLPAMTVGQKLTALTENLKGSSAKVKSKLTQLLSSQKFKEFLSKENLKEKLTAENIKNSLSKENLDKMLNKVQKISQGQTANKLLAFLEDIFKVESRPKIHRAFLMSLLICTPYLIGKIVGLILSGTPVPPKVTHATPLPPTMNLTQELESIKMADLFKTEIKAPTQTPTQSRPKVDQSLICKSATSKTTLPIKILHTTVMQDSIKSLASVQVRNGKDLEYMREGERIESLATLGKIDRLRVIIKNLTNGRCEYIENEEKIANLSSLTMKVHSPSEGRELIKDFRKGGVLNQGNNYTIPKNLLGEKMKNIGSVLTEARATPIQNPDGSLFFKIDEVEPGGTFAILGVQNEDEIRKVNGKTISSMNEIMDLFGKIGELEKLEITVFRDGQEVKQKYRFR